MSKLVDLFERILIAYTVGVLGLLGVLLWIVTKLWPLLLGIILAYLFRINAWIPQVIIALALAIQLFYSITQEV